MLLKERVTAQRNFGELPTYYLREILMKNPSVLWKATTASAGRGGRNRTVKMSRIAIHACLDTHTHIHSLLVPRQGA